MKAGLFGLAIATLKEPQDQIVAFNVASVWSGSTDAESGITQS
jgi:hypothetical protein